MRRAMLGCLVLSACVAMQAYSPLQVRVTATDADIYTAAVRVLGEIGYGLRTQDRDGGLIVTEWESVSFGIGNYKHAWRITVIEGRMRLAIDCQTMLPNGPFEQGERFGPCGEGSGRHPDWVRRQPRLRDDIVAMSEWLARKRAAGKTP